MNQLHVQIISCHSIGDRIRRQLLWPRTGVFTDQLGIQLHRLVLQLGLGYHFQSPRPTRQERVPLNPVEAIHVQDPLSGIRLVFVTNEIVICVFLSRNINADFLHHAQPMLFGPNIHEFHVKKISVERHKNVCSSVPDQLKKCCQHVLFSRTIHSLEFTLVRWCWRVLKRLNVSKHFFTVHQKKTAGIDHHRNHCDTVTVGVRKLEFLLCALDVPSKNTQSWFHQELVGDDHRMKFLALMHL
mmetsp:Transcript_48612/g.128575  ORF Transcript_48612/g.128575 Transcript_48612/m.128575 type:complete len:242 (+) Transcript_48612:5575-6300(+)